MPVLSKSYLDKVGLICGHLNVHLGNFLSGGPPGLSDYFLTWCRKRLLALRYLWINLKTCKFDVLHLHILLFFS